MLQTNKYSIIKLEFKKVKFYIIERRYVVRQNNSQSFIRVCRGSWDPSGVSCGLLGVSWNPVG